MGIDYWNASKWRRMITGTDVFACTTQVFLNCLRRGYFKLQEFCLLILDECHHTEKNHAFNNIMREFYFYALCRKQESSSSVELPYIIGMTASPASLTKNVSHEVVKEKLLSLCANLNSNFVWFNPHVLCVDTLSLIHI
eukprot:TRINITY_DN23462_c0_g1_i2.p1 TRINITY_DN23462_c0_g1~~TRINITY_DN23462_c0_g1_i2.p1  ORF type:complete len:139 (+),score=22.76 TRINITY_DN23462_c0_g1_i2:85-501(+)